MRLFEHRERRLLGDGHSLAEQLDQLQRRRVGERELVVQQGALGGERLRAGAQAVQLGQAGIVVGNVRGLEFGAERGDRAGWWP